MRTPARELKLCEPGVDATIRVVVAGGHAVVRAGIRALLEADENVDVVAEARTGEAAVALARGTQPDVVIMDAAVPGLEIVEATRQIRSYTDAAVLLVVGSDDDDCIFGGLRAGAAGLVLKDSESTDLVRAVELLASGEAALAPRLTRRLIEEFVSRPVPDHPHPELVDELTAREREVVALVGHGLDNAEIAERLVITPATAKSHVSRAMVKLGASDRAKVVVFAYEAGLVTPRVDLSSAAQRPLAPAAA